MSAVSLTETQRIGEAALATLLKGPPTAPPRLTGRLSKLASNWISGFQERHVEVGAGRLRYWHAVKNMESGEDPCAEYTLLGVTVKEEPFSDSKFEVRFLQNAERPYQFSADAGESNGDDDPISREEWIDALECNAEYAKRKAAYDRAAEIVLPTETSWIGSDDTSSDGTAPVKSYKSVQFNDIASFCEFTPHTFSVASFGACSPGKGLSDCPSFISPQVFEQAVTLVARGVPLEPAPVSGAMLKKATAYLRRFQQRHVQIAKGKFCYWHSLEDMEAGAKPQAEYLLIACQSWSSSQPASQFELTFRENLARPYILQATGDISREDWLAAIAEHEEYIMKLMAYNQAAAIADC